MNNSSFNSDLKTALSMIHRKDPYTKQEADEISAQVVRYWKDAVNPGFLEYRKSVAEDFAAIEWRDGTPGGIQFISLHGTEYLDFLGGFGIFNCGHRHPKILSAVQAQLEKQALHTQELLDPLRAFGAKLLQQLAPGDLKYCFFTNSGTESVEACLKTAILATKRHHFIACVGAFHGKTLGSLAATSKSVFRAPFVPALVNFTHVPLNNLQILESAFEAAEFSGNKIAGCLLEPIQGEGGIHIADHEFLRAARRLCTKYGAMLIFDEVQSGMGRTGKWWGCQHSGVNPDVMALGKALGGGIMPVGCCMAVESAWTEFFENPFLFTTTFGGNPLAMAAMIATINVIQEEDLVNQAAQKGEYFMKKLREVQKRFPTLFKEVRGLGLMIGVEFQTNEIGYAISKGCFSRGIVVSGTLINSKTLRLEPAITVQYHEIDRCVLAIHDSLLDLERSKL